MSKFFNEFQFAFRVFDVGGQRSERKKWIHCFEVRNFLFCPPTAKVKKFKVLKIKKIEKISKINEIVLNIQTYRISTILYY